MKIIRVLILTVFLMLPAYGDDGGDFVIEIEFDRNTCQIRLVQEDQITKRSFDFDQVQITNNQVFVQNDLLIDHNQLLIGQASFPVDELTVADVTKKRDSYLLLLEKKRSRYSRRSRSTRDLSGAFEKIVVEQGDFVRGDLLAFGGEVTIEGEINGNAVVFFGDIRLARTAICYNNVLAIGGKVKSHRESRVYGELQSTGKWKKPHRPRGRRYRDHENAVDFGLGLGYNRVDGLLASCRLAFESREKAVPLFFAEYGYGFWSKRSKYKLGFEQTLFDYHQLRFGGSLYRETLTQDEWIVNDGENTFYALIWREDFRDYYEGEGGDFFIEQTIGYNHTFRAQYKFEELRFMPANPNLWSLFGGDKKFRSNFSSIDEPLRSAGISDYDNDEATLCLSYLFDTVEDIQGDLARSGWLARMSWEHSSDDLGSDFDYDRYIVELRRFQPLTYRQNINLRLIYGASNGELPLHRMFYLGGIRTLRAYKIKQFYGRYMALANLEYVITLPRSTVGLALLFDIGKTGNESDFLTQDGWKADVGVGLSFGKGLRLELTRQVNGFEDSIQFSAQFGRSF